MAKSKLAEQGLLQIRSVDPAIIRKFKVYAASNGMTYAEVFTQLIEMLPNGHSEKK